MFESVQSTTAATVATIVAAEVVDPWRRFSITAALVACCCCYGCCRCSRRGLVSLGGGEGWEGEAGWPLREQRPSFPLSAPTSGIPISTCDFSHQSQTCSSVQGLPFTASCTGSSPPIVSPCRRFAHRLSHPWLPPSSATTAAGSLSPLATPPQTYTSFTLSALPRSIAAPSAKPASPGATTSCSSTSPRMPSAPASVPASAASPKSRPRCPRSWPKSRSGHCWRARDSSVLRRPRRARLPGRWDCPSGTFTGLLRS